ncbi:MAG: GxxExxY protein, partial [Acidobacteriota bacterium]
MGPQTRGLEVGQQVIVPIGYKGRTLGNPLRLDLIVEKRVIVEVKATSNYNTLFEAQALTYLRLTGLEVALVINFGARRVIDGVEHTIALLDDILTDGLSRAAFARAWWSEKERILTPGNEGGCKSDNKAYVHNFAQTRD